MDEKPFGVHVVVDSRFGNRLREIPTGEPVWIVDTPINRLAYEAVAKERAPESYFDGLTSFKVDPEASPEDWLLSELETIDLHHGEMSHDPPWSVINVIGTKWTRRIQEVLARFGFWKYENTLEGFTAKRDAVQEATPRIEEAT